MADLIETGKYMNIRGKKLYVETHGDPKNKPVLYLHGGPEKVAMIFISSSGTFKRFFICNYDDQRGVCRSEEITEDEAFGLNDLIEDCEELKSITN